MAKTYAQFLSQIDALRAKADAVRRKEAAGQIKKVRDLISLYGLTAEDLGLSAATATAKMPGQSPTPRKTSVASVAAGAPKYHDGAGHSWTGRGPRPGWLKAALAEGRSLDEFTTKAAGPDSVEPPTAGQTPKSKQTRGKTAAKPSVQAVKFRLGDKGWSGRGPQPRWLKDAVENGKSLDDLRV